MVQVGRLAAKPCEVVQDVVPQSQEWMQLLLAEAPKHHGPHGLAQVVAGAMESAVQRLIEGSWVQGLLKPTKTSLFVGSPFRLMIRT